MVPTGTMEIIVMKVYNNNSSVTKIIMRTVVITRTRIITMIMMI